MEILQENNLNFPQGSTLFPPQLGLGSAAYDRTPKLSIKRYEWKNKSSRSISLSCSRQFYEVITVIGFCQPDAQLCSTSGFYQRDCSSSCHHIYISVVRKGEGWRKTCHVISLQGLMLEVSQNSSVYIPLARRHNHVITSVMLTSVFILDGSVPAKNGGCCYQERRE